MGNESLWPELRVADIRATFRALIAATGCIYMYPLMENQPYAADCERVGFGDITDRGTTHVWSPEASTDTPKSPVWVAVFEHRA